MLCELGWSIYTRIYHDGLLVVGPGVSEGGEGELLLGDGGAGLQQPAHVRTRGRSSVLKYRQHWESLSEHDSCFALLLLSQNNFLMFLDRIRIRTDSVFFADPDPDKRTRIRYTNDVRLHCVFC